MTQEEADKMLDEYDGYKLTFIFDDPQIPPFDKGAIDAGCIFNLVEAGGGVCAGIIYNAYGNQELKAKKWALWADTADFEVFNLLGPLQGVDDTENWSTQETKFNANFAMTRLLPKEQRNFNYYLNSFRFYGGMFVDGYTYQSLDGREYALNLVNPSMELAQANHLLTVLPAATLATLFVNLII